jgi:hypothetical protein
MVKNIKTGAQIYFVDSVFKSAYTKASDFIKKNKEYELYYHSTSPYTFTDKADG